jgi:hypothetical protein
MFNFLKNLGLAKRFITFITNIKKHYETVTVDDKVKVLVENFINNLKEFGNLTPELKVEADYLISEVKKLLECKEEKKK